MLSQDVFKNGLKELMLAFNMELREEQIKIWYKYCKNIKDSEFEERIRQCILTCNHKPYIADLMNLEVIKKPRIEYA